MFRSALVHVKFWGTPEGRAKSALLAAHRRRVPDGAVGTLHGTLDGTPHGTRTFRFRLFDVWDDPRAVVLNGQVVLVHFDPEFQGFFSINSVCFFNILFSLQIERIKQTWSIRTLPTKCPNCCVRSSILFQSLRRPQNQPYKHFHFWWSKMSFQFYFCPYPELTIDTTWLCFLVLFSLNIPPL